MDLFPWGVREAEPTEVLAAYLGKVGEVAHDLVQRFSDDPDSLAVARAFFARAIDVAEAEERDA